MESFKNNQFAVAKVDFQQLLARYPESPSYNFYYGVCLFQAEDKNKAKRYLEFSINQSATFCDAHFYLGKIYHLAYQFDEAIASYEKYKSCNPSDPLHATTEIEYCKNGKSLLASPKSLQLLSRQISAESNFFQKYDLEAIGGKIYADVTLQTKLDKKKAHVPICYFKRGETYKFYSSFGPDHEQQKI